MGKKHNRPPVALRLIAALALAFIRGWEVTFIATLVTYALYIVLLEMHRQGLSPKPSGFSTVWQLIKTSLFASILQWILF